MVALARRPEALVVDDDRGVRTAVGSVLLSSGCLGHPAECLEEAVGIAKARRIDFGIIDVHVRAEDGLEIVGRLRGIVIGLPVILMSGAFTPEILGRAQDLGAHQCLTKPLDLARLRTAIWRLVESERLWPATGTGPDFQEPRIGP